MCTCDQQGTVTRWEAVLCILASGAGEPWAAGVPFRRSQARELGGFTSLRLGVPICKMGTASVPTLRVCLQGYVNAEKSRIMYNGNHHRWKILRTFCSHILSLCSPPTFRRPTSAAENIMTACIGRRACWTDIGQLFRNAAAAATWQSLRCKSFQGS